MLTRDEIVARLEDLDSRDFDAWTRGERTEGNGWLHDLVDPGEAEDRTFAETLHGEFCRHGPHCTFDAETWASPGPARGEWLRRAKQLFAMTGDRELAHRVTLIVLGR